MLMPEYRGFPEQATQALTEEERRLLNAGPIPL